MTPQAELTAEVAATLPDDHVLDVPLVAEFVDIVEFIDGITTFDHRLRAEDGVVTVAFVEPDVGVDVAIVEFTGQDFRIGVRDPEGSMRRIDRSRYGRPGDPLERPDTFRETLREQIEATRTAL